MAKNLSNYDNKNSLGSRLRAKRLTPLLEMIEGIACDDGIEIIDVGGTERYWSILPIEYLRAHNVTITIVNLPGTILAKDHDCFKFVCADGCDLSAFGDKSFHIAHSNSVVEHVGDWGRMVKFANEIKRVSVKLFVQTPNYWFPIEPHCMTPMFNWLPKPIRVWLVLRFNLGHWKRASTVDEAVRIVESARLLDRSMFRELFQESQILTERFFLLPKSFIAVSHCDSSR
jgi:hypothetical protein